MYLYCVGTPYVCVCVRACVLTVLCCCFMRFTTVPAVCTAGCGEEGWSTHQTACDVNGHDIDTLDTSNL